jgi:hypothetical protein
MKENTWQLITLLIGLFCDALYSVLYLEKLVVLVALGRRENSKTNFLTKSRSGATAYMNQKVAWGSISYILVD